MLKKRNPDNVEKDEMIRLMEMEEAAKDRRWCEKIAAWGRPRFTISFPEQSVAEEFMSPLGSQRAAREKPSVEKVHDGVVSGVWQQNQHRQIPHVSQFTSSPTLRSFSLFTNAPPFSFYKWPELVSPLTHTNAPTISRPEKTLLGFRIQFFVTMRKA